MDIVQHPHSTSASPGGSPANVAFGLARLGVATDLCAHFGDDPEGEILREHLEVAGVALLPTGAGNTTSTALAVLGAAEAPIGGRISAVSHRLHNLVNAAKG
ncbi:PfkB family carbohydrate kinase [Arthrobacter glacialis]|uniref:PfkB family carbohydrate kinase n=1 Tax=Arthrobacter glacialis TaxID=1664 RepID=UPI001FAE7923|nr:PfkB family carbohydrate kinase [Arthrobacter glacialis]